MDAFDKAIQNNPASYMAWQSKGLILQSLGQMDEALECYELAIDLDKLQISGYIAKANLLNDSDEREAAITTLNQAIQVNPTSTEGYLYLSQFYSKKNESQKALEIIQQGITRLPGSAEMYAARGEILKQLALELQENLDATHAKDQSIEERQEFETRNKGEIQRIRLLLDEARNDYEQALEFQPINATALVGLGQISALEGDHTKALEFFNSATRFNPLMDIVWISIGDYYLQVKKWPEAYDAYNRAVILSPSNSRARSGLQRGDDGL